MMQRKWLRNGSSIILSLILLFSLLITSVHADGVIASDQDAVYTYLKNYHIDGSNLEKQDIDAMIESLDDPYTEYFTREAYDAFIGQIDGTLVGVGIYLEDKDGSIIVVSPVKDSPAEAAGILAGDIIIGVDGASVIGKKASEIVPIVRGVEGTEVSLTVQRGTDQFTYTIIRAKIELPLVEYEYVAEDRIGYVQLNSFGDNTYPKMVEAIEYLEAQGMDSLILDVRGNSGGKVDSVIDVASYFVGEGPVLWVKDGSGQENVFISEGRTWWHKPMVLLIDKGSASASEILAGVLQDYQLATVVGDSSFGKGVMQSLVGLPSGNVLKLTTNEFFSPRKHAINRVGIRPDFVVTAEEDPIGFATEWLKNAQALRSGKTGAMTVEHERVRSIDEWYIPQDQGYIALYRLQAMLGGELHWRQETRTATYTLDGVTQTFTMGKDTMIVKNSRIYAPIQSLLALPNMTITPTADGSIILERK